MALIHEPEIDVNNFYTLKIEWADLDINFTHNDNNLIIDVFNTSQFYEFMNYNYDKNMRLIDVVINYQIFDKLYVNIDSYIEYIIEKYQKLSQKLSVNFLAISPNETQKIVIRSSHLLLFPKFFENWKLIPITTHSDYEHINNFKQIIAQNFNGTQNWTLDDYIFFTLVNKKIYIVNRFGFSHPPEFHKTVEEINNNYSDFSNYLQLYIGNDQFKDWDDVCNNFHYWYKNEILKDSKPISLLQEFVAIKKFFKNVELFHVAFQSFENQKQLFVSIPLDINCRKLTINF